MERSTDLLRRVQILILISSHGAQGLNYPHLHIIASRGMARKARLTERDIVLVVVVTNVAHQSG